MEPDGRLRLADSRRASRPRRRLDFLHKVLANTAVQDKSAREALQTFAGGKGDVLLAYENEAITAQKAGIDLDYVVPDQTILIQNPAAVTKESKAPTRRRRSSTGW